jgi:hypothetical protein
MLGKNITNVLHEKRLRIYNNKQQKKGLFRIRRASEFYLVTISIRVIINVDLKKQFSWKV